MLSRRKNREGWLLRVIIIGILVGIMFVIFDTVVNAPESDDTELVATPGSTAPDSNDTNSSQDIQIEPPSTDIPNDQGQPSRPEATAELTAEAASP